MRRTNDLRQLLTLLTEDEGGRAAYLHPRLTCGDIWWLSDAVTRFNGGRARHPWVVVEDYDPSRPAVYICPRTSKLEPPRPSIRLPAGLLDGLDKEGLVLFRHRLAFDVEDFRAPGSEYIGRLPEEWLNRLREAYRNDLRRRGRV